MPSSLSANKRDKVVSHPYGLAAIVAFSSLSVPAMFWVAHPGTSVVIAIAISALALTISVRHRVCAGENGIEYRSWFKTVHVPWADITDYYQMPYPSGTDRKFQFTVMET